MVTLTRMTKPLIFGQYCSIKYVTQVSILNFVNTNTIRLYTKPAAAAVAPIAIKEPQDKPLQKQRNKDLKDKNSSSNSGKVSDELKKHFSTKELKEILEIFPEKLRRKKHKSEHLYLSDPAAVAHIYSKITQNFDKKSIFVEINPGPGLLTKQLINGKINNLKLFETLKPFSEYIKKNIIENNYTDKINVINGDFLGLFRNAYLDKIDSGNRVSTLLNQLPQKRWNDDCVFRMFACVGSLNFFKYLINSTVFQTGLMSLGRPEMYFVVPPPLYMQIASTKDAGYFLYRSTTILFQIMFSHEFITKIPRKYFLPYQFKPDLSTKNKWAKYQAIDMDYMYLIRIEPRKNLFTLCPPEHLTALWYFIKQNCSSRKNRIIPNLEKWIPGCGINLLLNSKKSNPSKLLEQVYNEVNIPEGTGISTTISKTDYYKQMNIFTEFGDLTPSQLLTVFRQFISWPGYQTSPFIASLENNLLKLETSEDDVIIHDNQFHDEDIIVADDDEQIK